MKKLIELIVNDELENCSNLSKNAKIRKLIELLNQSTEEESKEFLKEFEEVLKSVPMDRVNVVREAFEYICSEVKLNQKHSTSNNNNDFNSDNALLNSKSIGQLNTNSIINSPEKQSNNGGGTRWLVPRDDRRKILEQMERLREEQKRRKKKDWYRPPEGTDEFEELWSSENGRIEEEDLELMKINEGNLALTVPEVKKVRLETPPPSTATFPVFNYEIVDFDCIEQVLISLTNSKASANSASAAKFILKIAEDIYRSDDLMFYHDLRQFDQPHFTHYGQDDDLSSLKYYNFSEDDLGRFVRGRSYQDHSRKFYRERAFRHRYISRKPFNLFFPNGATFRRLRDEVEYLDRNCDEFHFWISKSITKQGTIFVSGKPLLKSFTLLLVLSSVIEINTFEISNSIWSHFKYGAEWTLKEILSRRPGNPCYLTNARNSELSIEANRLGIKFV